MALAIETNDLSKSYGAVLAVDKVSLRVPEAELYGFLGLNEAVRKGAQGINVDVKLASGSATAAQLEELVRELPHASPIHDTLANPVRVTARLVD